MAQKVQLGHGTKANFEAAASLTAEACFCTDTHAIEIYDGTGTFYSYPAGGGLTVGTTTVGGGSSGNVLYDNAGVLGEKAVTGTGSVVLATSPTLTDAAINQAANGDTAITSTRATDTSPTGNFIDLKNHAGTSMWTVDVTGTLTAGTWHGAAVGAAYGGTGGDSSASTGVAHVSSGAWSYSTIATADIAAAAVTYAKIQNASAHVLLGNPTGSAAAPSEVTLGSGLAFSGTTLTATGSGGTVTSITAGTGLTGGTITTSGTIALASTIPQQETIQVTDAVTNSDTVPLLLQHRSSGTPVAGFGCALSFAMDDSANVLQNAGQWIASWVTATSGSQKARNTLWASDSGGYREAIRFESSGSAALLGFYGHAAAAQQSGDVATGLVNLGLFSSATVSATYPPGYVKGLRLSYGSSNTFTVGAGSCVDSTNATNMTLANATGISTATNGSLGGMDQKSLTGTMATSTTNTTVTATGGAFLTDFGTRAISGTISSSSTTVTGTGTSFLSQVRVGDLIGNTAANKGYFQVTAIASDSVLTIASAPVAAFSSDSVNVIELPVIKVGTQSARQVVTITGNNTLTLNANSSATGSGLSAVAGTLYGGDGSNNLVYSAWVVVQSGTTGVILSSQRTTPYLSSVTAYRRVGSVTVDSSGNIIPFSQAGAGNYRWVNFVVPAAGNNTQLASSINVASWTDVVASQLAPASADTLLLSLYLFHPTADNALYARPRNCGGGGTATANVFAQAANGGLGCSSVSLGCDGAQGIQYTLFASGGSPGSIFCYGYGEVV